MDFDWSENEKDVKGRVAAVFSPDLTESINAMDEAESPVIKETLLRVQKALGETDGWEFFPGRENGMQGLEMIAADSEVAKVSASLFLALQATKQFSSFAVLYENEKIKAELLGPLGRGEVVGAVALTDPGDKAGDPPASLSKDGDSYRLNGGKAYVTNGPIADWIAVFAEFDGRDALCLLSPDQEGIRIGERIRMLGFDGLPVSGLTFDNVLASDDRILGPFDDDAMRTRFVRHRDLSLALAGVGIAKRAFNSAKKHADDHQRNGKPSMAYQEVRFKLAEMLTLARTAELLCCRAAWMMISDNFEADTVIRCAKVFCAENAEVVASGAMQIMAGQGYMHGSVAEKAYRDAKGTALIGTTVEVARMKIADEMLSRY